MSQGDGARDWQGVVLQITVSKDAPIGPSTITASICSRTSILAKGRSKEVCVGRQGHQSGLGLAGRDVEPGLIRGAGVQRRSDEDGR